MSAMAMPRGRGRTPGRNVALTATRGAVLIGVAVVIGLVLLQVVDDAGGGGGGAASGGGGTHRHHRCAGRQQHHHHDHRVPQRGAPTVAGRRAGAQRVGRAGRREPEEQ